jgi:formylglycine-generating enzyme required for sulfatase activity
VHLALFADMCKGRAWRPETLQQVGGARGIGVKFLEETFESTTAPLEHRVHEKASRAVLKSLLPDVGSNIRGQSRDRDQLAQIASYAPDSREFEALLGVLDRNTRLITPVEQEAAPGAVETNGAAADKRTRYQLTHDYLVPSLREWLTKKQRETARGRAELKLEEFTHLWNDKPIRQRLPGAIDWFSMRTLTPRAQWTAPQRKMMTAAGRRLGTMTALAAGLLLCMALVGREVRQNFREQRLAAAVEQLATAQLANVDEIVSELKPSSAAAAPLLVSAYAMKDAAPAGRLNTALAALSLGVASADADAMLDQVYAAMRKASPDDLAAMMASVSAQGKTLGERAAKELTDADAQTPDILPVASLVAAFQPKADWQAAAREAVALQLVAAPADSIGDWVRQLRPARNQLAPPLQAVFEDAARPPAQRNVAGDLLVAFAPEDGDDRVRRLVDLLEHSTSPEQFKRIIRQLEPLAAPASKHATERLAELEKIAAGTVGAEREALGTRQMYLHAGVLQLAESTDAWQAFQHTPEPTVRSLLVDNAHHLAIEPSTLIERLTQEREPSIQRALLLSLGEYEKGQLEALELADFSTSLEKWAVHEDAGLRAAADWLRNKWIVAGLVKETPEAASRDEQAALAHKGDSPTWYATGEHHDMVTFRGPIEFEMGAAKNDPDREGGALDDTELRHPVRIPRSFAIASKEVTVAQFLAAWPDLRQRTEFLDAKGKPIEKFPYAADKAPEPNCPAVNVEWFKAAAYCNWLSQREGIPSDQWCYSESELFQHRMVLPKDYLTRIGYRLPTEAEWEYACRAGATSGRYFGECASLLPKYGWYLANGENRTWPAGQLKPNEFGLFDMYGNAEEWCLDEPRIYGADLYTDAEAEGQARLIDEEKLRVIRGGGFQYVPAMVTSAGRDRADPNYSYFSLGFRVARTLPAAP